MVDNLSNLYGEWDLLAVDLYPQLVDNHANGMTIWLQRDGHDTFITMYEDECDGYRSCATDPIVTHESKTMKEQFRIPVVLREDPAGNTDAIELMDRRNGKTILRLGTDNTDDYYPYFTAYWEPRNIAENEQREKKQ